MSEIETQNDPTPKNAVQWSEHGNWVRINNEMTWPRIGATKENISWRLRYLRDALTVEERLFVASVMDAYNSLVCSTQKKRNLVCRVLNYCPVRSDL